MAAGSLKFLYSGILYYAQFAAANGFRIKSFSGIFLLVEIIACRSVVFVRSFVSSGGLQEITKLLNLMGNSIHAAIILLRKIAQRLFNASPQKLLLLFVIKLLMRSRLISGVFSFQIEFS